MKYLTCLAILLMAVFSSCTAEKGGLKAVGRDTVDFGQYPARERKTARFKIRNTGSEQVRIIKLHKTCGCATAVCSKETLKPGEEAGVEVVILSNSIFGFYNKPTYVQNSDVANPFLSLTVKGTAVPLVEIKPQDFLYAGRIETNKSWSQVFELAATEAGVQLGEPQTKWSHPAEVVVNRTGQEPASSWKLDVMVCPSSTSGDLQGRITIPVLAPTNQPPLVVGISGKIGAEMVAFPGTFRLAVSSNETVRSFGLKVLGDESVVLDPALLKFPVTNGVACEAKQNSDGRTLSATIRFSPEFTTDLSVQEKACLYFSFPGVASAKVVCRAEKPVSATENAR
jgi:hypothetical protein